MPSEPGKPELVVYELFRHSHLRGKELATFANFANSANAHPGGGGALLGEVGRRLGRRGPRDDARGRRPRSAVDTILLKY